MYAVNGHYYCGDSVVRTYCMTAFVNTRTVIMWLRHTFIDNASYWIIDNQWTLIVKAQEHIYLVFACQLW